MEAKRLTAAAAHERFEVLLEGHLGIVFRVVRTYSREVDDEQDLAQEIKLQLWRAFSGYDETRAFSTWMYRIALNTAISWSRRTSLRTRHTTKLDEIQISQVSVGLNEEALVLYRLIDQLNPLDRAVLLLYLDDLSHAEIGGVLGITSGNAATKISRLKQRLREAADTGETKK